MGICNSNITEFWRLSLLDLFTTKYYFYLAVKEKTCNSSSEDTFNLYLLLVGVVLKMAQVNIFCETLNGKNNNNTGTFIIHINKYKNRKRTLCF